MKTIFAVILAALVLALPASANHLKPGKVVGVTAWCISEKVIDAVLSGKHLPGCFRNPRFGCEFIRYGKTHLGLDGKSKFRVVKCISLVSGMTIYSIEGV